MILSKKRLLSNRRGVAITVNMLLKVADWVLAIVVLLAMLNFVSEVSDRSIFEKNFLVRDIATTMNTVYAAPGDVTYTYRESVEDYELIVSANILALKDFEALDATETRYVYAYHSLFPLALSNDQRSELLMLKQKEQFFIEGKYVKEKREMTE